MARIRSIKPEFWTSDQVADCSIPARLLFIGLWNFCDDCGRHPLSAKRIKALIFPSDDISINDVWLILAELDENGLIEAYSVDGKEYFYVTGWLHQKIDRPQPAKYPGPENGSTFPVRRIFDEHSSNHRRALATDRKGRDGIGGDISSQEAEPLQGILTNPTRESAGLTVIAGRRK